MKMDDAISRINAVEQLRNLPEIANHVYYSQDEKGEPIKCYGYRADFIEGLTERVADVLKTYHEIMDDVDELMKKIKGE